MRTRSSAVSALGPYAPDPTGSFHFALPLLFVLLYGSGFVGAKYGLPYCEPLTFLVLRFAIAFSLITIVGLILRAPWPRTTGEAAHIAIAGMLTVGTFSAGVFVSLKLGISPALSALIVALQPILVTLAAQRLLGERANPLQWMGLLLGFFGVTLVVWHRVTFDSAHAMGVIMSVVGLLGLAAGNLYQKRFCSHMNVITGGAIQSGVSALATLPLAMGFEGRTVEWNPDFVGALLYMAIGVSIGALSLLYVMIRRGEVSKVASVFYLVPVSAAVASYFLFGEHFDGVAMGGVAIVAIGVTLVVRAPKAR